MINVRARYDIVVLFVYTDSDCTCDFKTTTNM